MQFANIFFGRRRTDVITTAKPARIAHPAALTRTFVETFDERCPIAGIWSRLDDTGTTLDEPEITRPTKGHLLLRRAVHFPLIFMQYTSA